MKKTGSKSLNGPFRSLWSVGYLLLLFVSSGPVPGFCQQGSISFAQPQIVVDEDNDNAALSFTSVQIPLIREGGTAGIVAVSIQVTDPNSDFLSSNAVATFLDGSTENSATLVIRNDAIPEGNETFTLTIVEARNGAVIGSRNTMQLIIRASDRPHGLIQFHSNSLSSVVPEPTSASDPGFMITVVRGPGTLGRITVNYQIVPSDSSLGLDDVGPTQGQLVFADGSSSENITLRVTPDSIPESREVFLVRLVNPTGGALLAGQNTEASIIIQPNDAPISWEQTLTTVEEDSGLILLTVTRGVLSDGSMAGDLSVESTVQVSSSSGSASSGSDFDPVSQTVTFSPETSSVTVPINILNDNLPEGDEMFTMVLSSPSPDAILAPPSTTTVLIGINDNAGGLVSFVSPGPVVIGEDDQSVGRFVIRRTVGTFRNLTVEWRITNNVDNSLASSDFLPAQGNITIPNGARDGFLDVTAFDDSLPEVSEGFTVELVRVISDFGGLSDSGPRLASLIVAESDDVYGLLEWADDQLLSVAGTVPRELRLAINRSGDSIGIVAVDYSIIYLPPQITDPSQVDPGMALTFNGSVQFQGGQTLRDFSLTVPDNAFLEVGGNFMATLVNASLIGGATFLIPTTNSPRIGSQSQVLIEVSVLATSGFISFAPQSQQVSVSEPETLPSLLDLNVTRSGSFGVATITWAISSQSADSSDIGSTAGQVVIANGANSALFQVPIEPDDVPEVNETFIITLIIVNEPNQMILQQQSMATVTILANDDPSGVFSISNSTRGPFLLNEDTNGILIITITRSRGDLTSEFIRYDLLGQQGEIDGGQGLANFQPGVRQFNVTLFVRNDNIPEINETFTFMISSLSPNVRLENPTTAEVTIAANDDYAGVFSFNTSSLTISISEPMNNSSVGPESQATLAIVRSAGSFGAVEVFWEVTNPSADLSPTRGMVSFLERETTASFQISAEADNDPEAAETYSVMLIAASGDARLASSATTATLIILQNDDPIRFDRSFSQVREGEMTPLTLIRGGQANGSAEVQFTINYQTASLDDVQVVPSDGLVMFAPGASQASILVEVINDSTPEEEELLVLSLVSVVSGDAVLVSPLQATLAIQQSDDPNGLFSFAEGSLRVEAQEGDTLILTVMRGQGLFGTVSLSWMIYSIDGGTGVRSAASATDLSPTSGILTFPPSQVNQTILLHIQDDSIPELAEILEVELSILSVEDSAANAARLDNNSVATIIIGESDEPNGVLVIADSSAMVTVAEDVPPENTALGQAQIQVERRFGTIGYVRALWEIWLLSDINLPDFVDVIFFGERGTDVRNATLRPNTGTAALQFTGETGSVLTVPPQYHPTNITNGFTISTWLQPSSNANGMLLAKTSDSGLIYSLGLISDGNNFLIRFSYQQSAGEQSLGLSTVEVSVPKSDLTDGNWHSLVVSIGGGRAIFYRDNILIDSRNLLSSLLGDEDGELTVGGLTSSNFYSGTLQDTRIYLGTLQPRQVEAVSSDVAASSLTPISGYVSFPAEISMATLSISSVDDAIPEQNEELVLSLSNVEGGARVSGIQDTATITVLKSDSSNGMFGFSTDSFRNSVGEPGNVTLSVNRSRGVFDEVTVTWEIRDAITDQIAFQDFRPATGSIVFQDGQTQQVFTVEAFDEMVPELNEEFVIVLTSAVANDNQTSSTPLSGASVDIGLSRSILTVTQNDFPYGVVQFGTLPPNPSETIPLATVMPEMTVDESDGMIRVYVVRAQGTVGNVSIEYFTSDGTATHLGLQPDYISSAGRLDFADGERVQSFTLSLIDDSTPELAKTFYVNLTNPRGSGGVPGLGVGQSLAVIIQPSDDAFGRFGFSRDSLSHIVPEQAGGVTVTLTVVREGGTFGSVSVYWSVNQSVAEGQVSDISPSVGEVTFSEGESQQQFTLIINDDQTAELMEVFTVSLVNVTVGASIISLSTATISIQASDHPYGRFVFSPAYRPLRGVAESGRAEVVVTREFGSVGQVMVDIQTVSSQIILQTLQLRDLLPELQQLINNSQLATTGEDYEAISETIVFENGQTTQSFYINITADSTPEINEYLFAVISRVELNQESLDSVDSSVLPSLVPGNDSLAVLIIAENDDARGVVQFSRAAISVTEPSQEFIVLERSAGSFGDISVQWEAVPVTAQRSDYSLSGGVITIPAGTSRVFLPLVISEDNLAEFSETFTVRLLTVSGGGRLGAITTSTITILQSDDPNGAFEFSIGSRQFSVEEPEDGASPRPVTLMVQRVGGTLGVVSVSWRVTSTSGDVSGDVLPVTGVLQFITAATQQSFLLSVLPDTIPELDEVFSVELVSATGGGRIGDFSVANITVPSNDAAHGVIQFPAVSALTTEVGDNGTSFAMLTITRRIGFFGDVRVLFNVQPTDVTVLALADGTSLLSYYTPPLTDLTLAPSALLQRLPRNSSLEDCGRACLSDRTCLSLSIDVVTNVCELYLATQSEGNSVITQGANYYQKLQDRVLPFYQSVASAGNDFSPVTGGSVIIPDGQMQASLPVTIIGDNVPELNESLTVTLTNVELVSTPSTPASPILGDLRQSTLVILENDDPHGVLVVSGTDGSSTVRVVEPDTSTFGVTLRVQRERGSIGQVSVRWSVSGGSATEGDDFIGTGATLIFDEGETQSTIALVILSDDVPEVDETLVVTLSDVTGGASIAPGNGGRVTVLINANDGVAGVVSFSPLSQSAVVGEGENVQFEVVRSFSAMGIVEVDWEITGTGNTSLEFVTTRDTVIFMEGENMTTIEVTVRPDTTPELAERYTLSLVQVRTISDSIASGSGAASLDLQRSTATITIRASNNPHGEVDFQAGSLSVTTDEGSTPQFTIIRQFGSFGAIDVIYRAENGSVGLVGEGGTTTFAYAGEDFISQRESVRLEDGQQSAVIAIHVIDDTIPEVTEVFIVRLLSVSLVGGPDETIPPSLGQATVAGVTIRPSDSPQGIITFAQVSYTVEETAGSVDIVIDREQGTVGQVSVFYFIINQQAVNEEDFLADPLGEIVFISGQAVSLLNIPIVNDTTPEIQEDFCVGLRFPRSGAILGNITTTCVSILPNDDAYGVFSFTLDSLNISLQETQGTATANNVAELRVERAGGAFGQVTVPYEVSPVGAGGAMLSDLSPVRGALLFNQDDRFRILQIQAVMDDIPELAESFLVTLLEPPTLGRLSVNSTVATIEVVPNQDPYGVLELFPVTASLVNGRIEVEENVGFIDYEVRRSAGSFGEITVTVQTSPRTATSATGEGINAATSQVFNSSLASVWFSFSGNNGQLFLALGTNSQALIYGWRGVFTPVQTLSANGVVAFATITPADGESVLIVANGGAPGNREILSHVYRFTGTDQLTMTQSLPTVGARDVVSFQSPNSSEWYVVVANGEDNTGNPNVDSLVYRWNGTFLEQSQILSSIGASALETFTIDGTLYMAMTSLTDTRSQVFIWNRGQFRLDHTFDTQRASDVIFLSLGPYLVVTSDTNGLAILTRSAAGRFTTNTTLALQAPIKVERVSDENGVFVVTNRQAPGQMFIATEENITPTEIMSISLPTARHIYSFMISSEDTLLGAAGVSLNSQEQSIIFQLSSTTITATDFYSRNLTLTFRPGETDLRFSVSIFDDEVPEIDEDFLVDLRSPTGGARLGQQTSATMIILTNDDAHGVLGFANSSRSVILSEMNADFVVSLDVERNLGTFGLVTADWMLSGGHMANEITPASGQVTFGDGASIATIMLLIRADNISELNEVTTVTLTRIVANGVSESGDQRRGARLALGQTEAVITVQANDEPHGVIAWSPTVVMVQEQEGTNNEVQLTLVREFGSIGAVVISYSTQVDASLPINERAESLMDFVPTSGEIVMGDGESSASIRVTILQDNIPEPNESFIVNITNVRIANEADRQGSSSNSPRLSAAGQSLQVVILENDNNRGLLNFTLQAVSVEENIGSQVVLQITRSRGTFGSISADYAIIEGTAGNSDYTTPPSSRVTFDSGEQAVNITIAIVNDQIPEVDETFSVELRNGVGGVEIGSPSSVTVTILSNDDINGIFFFSDSSSLVIISESGSNSSGLASLTVERGVGFVGESTIFWEVSSEGRQDLEPDRGSLTFQENVTMQSFSVRAIEDGIPESFEAFTIQLVSIEGGGRITNPRESRIAIQASDDPTGVLGLQQFPNGLIVNEGGVVTVGVVRQAGTFGRVTLTWDVTPPDPTVFATTTDTVVLEDGQTETSISIQTLSDNIPEVRRSFTLQVVSATLARIDVNATTVNIIIPASNNPHGSVEFASSIPITTSEGAMPTQLSILRSGGLIGPLRVNFTTVPGSASNMDFSINQEFVVIPSEETTAMITVNVVDDNIPELNEMFSIRLTSVELVDGSEDVTVLPTLGTSTEVTITIESSDDPFGSISLTQETYNVIEGNAVTLSLVRSRGSLGVTTITYATVNGRATSPEDFVETSGTLVFIQGQTSGEILVPTNNDSIPEVFEDFGFALLGVSQGSLGNITRATIIIAASDSPFGVVGFRSEDVSAGVSIANPTTSPAMVRLIVSRMGGTLGNTDITWNVTGPGSNGVPTSDISSSSIRGILTLGDGQSSGSIVITVLPTPTDEHQETFTVSLVSITNGVVIDSSLSQVVITVRQNGSPLGTISFLGDAIRTQRVREESVPSVLSLPLERVGDLSLDVSVSFSVSRVGGSEQPSLDVTPTSGIISFPVLQGVASVDLTILPDQTPEPDETFQVTLSNPTGGATIDPQANTATFIINANQNLFGLFGVANATISVSGTGDSIVRTLSYKIVRIRGGTVNTNIIIQHNYSQDSAVEVVSATITRSLGATTSVLDVSLPIHPRSILSPGSVISVTITNVTVSSPPEVAGMMADISTSEGSVQALVTNSVANIVIGFTADSLSTSVDDSTAQNNVMLTVYRRGTLGQVEVSWTTSATITSNFVAGSILPPAGTLRFPPQQNTTTLTLTASPVSPHGRAEVFAVSLVAISLDQLFPSQVDSGFERSLIEPMGVLQLSNTQYSSLEGTTVSIEVWRQYGSLGSIMVTGVASSVSESNLPSQVLPATPVVDFPSTPVSLTLGEGITTGFFSIRLPDNNLQSSLRAFQFSLNSVVASSPSASAVGSPRLSSVNTTAIVTIIDDEGGAGLFQLNPTSASTTEGSTLNFNIVRSRGTSGRTSVVLRTVQSGLATDGVDYQSLNQELTFENGVSQLLMSVNIMDDALPEGAEDFSIVLSAPTGGMALIDTNANSLNVTIQPSDNPAGVFSFITASLTLSEDGPTSGELEVRRTSGLAGVVIIMWEALYTDSRDHSVGVADILITTSGTIIFEANSTTPRTNILLQLRTDGVPEGGEEFSVRLSSTTAGVGFSAPTQAVIFVRPRTQTIYQFARSNLTSVVTSPRLLPFLIERSVGLQIRDVVYCNTSQPGQAVTVGRLTFQPALLLIHFTPINVPLVFNSGETSKTNDISVLSVGSDPVAFFVLLGPFGNNQVRMATVVISPPGPVSSLYSIYFEALAVSTPQELNKVSSDLLAVLTGGTISGADRNQSDITRFIIQELIQKTKAPVNINYSNNTQYVSNMLDIFQTLLNLASFEGRSSFVDLMKQFAYSLVEDVECNTPALIHTRPQFYLMVQKISPSMLAGRKFTSTSGADYVQLPAQVISTQLSCVNVHYFEFSTDHFFSSRSTLLSKVLSVGIEGITVLGTSDPVVYRIHTNQNLGLLPKRNDCLLWRYPTSASGDGLGNQWDTSLCSPQTHFVLQENYIQCSCGNLGDMAAAVDVGVGYGWTLPAGLSAAVTILALLLAIIIHFRYLSRTQLATRILLCLCLSAFLFQLMLLVDIFASDRADLPSGGCSAIGVLLQFTAVAQFIWIATMAVALWLNFIGFTSGNEPVVIYIIISWGAAVLVVVATILIGRFGANLSLETSSGLYGPVKDLCFMPLLSASLLSTVLPVVLSLLAMVALTAHTCVYWSRWEDVKSLYHDSFNRTDVPLLLLFFALIFLSSLTAYLHVYITVVYTFGAFIIFNTLQGLYVLVVYFFMSWHTMTRKHDKYNIADEVEALDVPGDDENQYFGSLSLSTLTSSKQHLIEKDESEGGSVNFASPGTGVVPLGMRPLHSSSDFGEDKPFPYTPAGEEVKDDSHMDDLLFMLKTQNFSGGSMASDDSDQNTHRSRHNRLQHTGAQHFERRRISIADTHL